MLSTTQWFRSVRSTSGFGAMRARRGPEDREIWPGGREWPLGVESVVDNILFGGELDTGEVSSSSTLDKV